MYQEAAEAILHSKYLVAFTGAGISVESGIPPYRGGSGIWDKYDQSLLTIGQFMAEPESSWPVIIELFYNGMKGKEPNECHLLLAELESKGNLKAVITQNIDNLHQQAGNKFVYEFHGNTQRLICLDCGNTVAVADTDLTKIPPRCKICEGLLKPDFVFFGEPIPEEVHIRSFKEAQRADTMLVIGTSGEVAPAGSVPYLAKLNGAMIIEINPDKSVYTDKITDIYIADKAIQAALKLRPYLGW
jgi:NAD-dependent deacetylase